MFDFDRLSNDQKWKSIKFVLILGLLLLIAQQVYLGFFHFPGFQTIRAIICTVFTVFFSYCIYLLIKMK